MQTSHCAAMREREERDAAEEETGEPRPKPPREDPYAEKKKGGLNTSLWKAKENKIPE